MAFSQEGINSIIERLNRGELDIANARFILKSNGASLRQIQQVEAASRNLESSPPTQSPVEVFPQPNIFPQPLITTQGQPTQDTAGLNSKDIISQGVRDNLRSRIGAAVEQLEGFLGRPLTEQESISIRDDIASKSILAEPNDQPIENIVDDLLSTTLPALQAKDFQQRFTEQKTETLDWQSPVGDWLLEILKLGTASTT